MSSTAYARFAVEFEGDLSGVRASMAEGLSFARLYGRGMADEAREGYRSNSRGALGGLSDGMAQFEGFRARFASQSQAFTLTCLGVSGEVAISVVDAYSTGGGGTTAAGSRPVRRGRA